MRKKKRNRIAAYYYLAVIALMVSTTIIAGTLVHAMNVSEREEAARQASEQEAEASRASEQEAAASRASEQAAEASRASEQEAADAMTGSAESETDESPDAVPDESTPEESSPEETGDSESESDTPQEETPEPGTPSPSPEETAAPETEPSETPAPETPAPETPAPETPAPETPAPETPAPETQPPETPAPEPVPPAPAANVHAISQEEINQIRAQFETNARGYGGVSYYRYAMEEQGKINATGAAARVLLDNGGLKNVALTFQEGWENGYTMQMLDILARYGVKASFYVTHEYAAMHQDIVRRMINEGHLVGSHTYLCPSIGIASYNLEDIMSDALQMQQFMIDTFGYTMSSYNYNAGTWSPASAVMLTRMGYQTIALCSASYVDYEAAASINPNTTLANMQAALIPGTIYAFHLTNPATVQFMPGLIEYCQSQGYTFTLVH